MAQISKGYTFSNSAPTNEVTASNLNELVDGATILNGAITEQTLKSSPTSGDVALIYASSENALRKMPVGAMATKDSVSGSDVDNSSDLSIGTHNVTAGGIKYYANLANVISFRWDGVNVCVYVDGTKRGTIPV